MKTITKLLACTAAQALIPAGAFAQPNFQPAKIATLSGDTLQGYIDYRGWDKSPELITFKPGLEAPTQALGPLAISGFKVNNERYISGQVAVETSSQNLATMTTSPVPGYRTEPAFLQALVTGPKSLYRYKSGKDSREYYYTGPPSAPDLLVFKRYKQLSEGPVQIRSNNQYQQQLGQYLDACPAIGRRLPTVRYDAGSLQRLFGAYYAACAPGQAATLLRKQTRTQAGLLLGATRSTLGFSRTDDPSYPVLDRYSQVGPTGGVYFYVPLPGNLGHFSFNNDLLYTSFSSSGTHTELASATSTTTTTSVALGLAYLKLSSLLRFTYPVGTGAVFVNAGLSNSYALQTENEKTVSRKFYSSEQTTTGEAFSGLRRYEQGIVAGAGASVRRLSAEVRYERSNGFLNSLDFNSSFQRYSLLVGFRLH